MRCALRLTCRRRGNRVIFYENGRGELSLRLFFCFVVVWGEWTVDERCVWEAAPYGGRCAGVVAPYGTGTGDGISYQTLRRKPVPYVCRDKKQPLRFWPQGLGWVWLYFFVAGGGGELNCKCFAGADDVCCVGILHGDRLFAVNINGYCKGTI